MKWSTSLGVGLLLPWKLVEATIQGVTTQDFSISVTASKTPTPPPIEDVTQHEMSVYPKNLQEYTEAMTLKAHLQINMCGRGV